jgi:DNA-binding MarR family transcriptional regulator
MIKSLENALGKVLRLSEHKQAVAAELLEQLAQGDATLYALSPDERAVVGETLARAKRREFASDADVDAILRRPWG